MRYWKRVLEDVRLFWPPFSWRRWWHLRKLRLALWRTSAIFSEHRRKLLAKSPIDSQGLAELDGEWSFEASTIQEEIDSLESGRLIQAAARLDVDTSFLSSADWERGHQTGMQALLPPKARELRKALKIERDARWSRWETRTKTIVPAATGLIGGLIGLVAVLKK